MADIVCTVPKCDAQAVLVLNGNPICRAHCEEFVRRAEVIEAPEGEVLTEQAGDPKRSIAGLLPQRVQSLGNDANPPTG